MRHHAKIRANWTIHCGDMATFRFFRYRACRIVTIFVAIGQAVAEIWRFFDFQDGGGHHLGILKFQFFERLMTNGRNGQEGRTASSCQISSILLEPYSRDSDFSIFQDGGCPPY